jgi:hypothetical protein
MRLAEDFSGALREADLPHDEGHVEEKCKEGQVQSRPQAGMFAAVPPGGVPA